MPIIFSSAIFICFISTTSADRSTSLFEGMNMHLPNFNLIIFELYVLKLEEGTAAEAGMAAEAGTAVVATEVN